MRCEMHKSKLISPEWTPERTASLIQHLYTEVSETPPRKKVRRKYTPWLVLFFSSYKNGKEGNGFSWG